MGKKFKTNRLDSYFGRNKNNKGEIVFTNNLPIIEKEPKESKKSLEKRIDSFQIKQTSTEEEYLHPCIMNGRATTYSFNHDDPMKPYCNGKCNCTERKYEAEKIYCGLEMKRLYEERKEKENKSKETRNEEKELNL